MKLALVTGGMRRLGAVIAERLARDGYQLALASHVAGPPDAGLLAALETYSVRWHPFVADLGNSDAPARLIDEVAAHFGMLPDLLVNNAALFGQDDWIAMNADTLAAHFQLNMFAPLLLSQALVSRAEKQVSIVHIADQRIVNPPRDQVSYTLSKQALAASVRTMATAFGKAARVNAVAPGLVIETDEYEPGQMARIADMMPLGALSDPAAVADAVAFLASAMHITGQILFVDGGANLKSFDRDFLHL